MTQEITCQLAHDIDTETFKGVSFPLWGFPKVDGVRAAAVRGFVGRSMDPFKNHALNFKFSHDLYAGLDGELTIDGLLTAEGLPEGETLCSLTTGLCNRSKLKKGEECLPDNAKWNLFDFLHPDIVHLPYEERYAALCTHVLAMPEVLAQHLHVLPYEVIENAEQALAFIAKCLDLQYEGAIFRNPKALHKSGRPGKRDNEFWRFKPTSDKDAVCTGFEEAETNLNEAKTNSLGRTERSSHKENKVGNGMVGTVLAIDVETGKPIRVGPGKMTHAFRVAAFKDPSLLVGQPFKYCSLDTGVKDAPRQARFITLRSRADMTPADLAIIEDLDLKKEAA
jgi:DNA ligase-1